MYERLVKYTLLMIGLCCVLLGFIGIFLPLLPTTPFLILALACFAKSSEKFHRWLLNAPYLGEILADWEKDKKICAKRKKSIYLMVVITFFISILILHERLALQLMLLIIMCVLLFFIKRIDEK